jgi:hypothetical protein
VFVLFLQEGVQILSKGPSPVPLPQLCIEHRVCTVDIPYCQVVLDLEQELVQDSYAGLHWGKGCEGVPDLMEEGAYVDVSLEDLLLEQLLMQVFKQCLSLELLLKHRLC